MFRKLLLGVIGISLVFLLPTMGRSQSTFGSITGTVTDPSGAMVPQAQVQVINEGTGAVHKTATSSAGVFNVPDLDLGTYRVQVTAKGFATYERGGLHLAANQILNVTAKLAVGATSTVVQVQGASPVINTETTDIHGGMGHEALQSLPLVGRHDGGSGGVYTYFTLTTGAARVGSSSTPIVQGARSQVGILPTMDGIAVMAYPQGAGPVQPSLQGVQEVRMETAVAPAEFPTAGNLQVITKSGTNQFHGDAFWNYNSNSLNARNFFSQTIPFRVYNNFGAAVGGPIKKNKLFFYGDYEGSREAATSTTTESVPLQDWRNGNFSSLLPGTQLVDPRTQQNYPGNVIPTGQISAVSQRIQDYAYPLPNVPGVVKNNWSQNFPGNTGFTHFDNYDARIDYNLDNRDAIFGRISYRKMPLLVSGVPYPLFRTQNRYGESAVFSWTHTLSPALLNEFRFGSTYHRNHYMATVVGSDLLSQFGITGVPTKGIGTAPDFNINGVTPWNPGSNSDNFEDNPETTLEWIDNVSWNHGKHMFKFGFDAIRDRLGGNNINSNVYGNYDFTGTYTHFGYADFLLGIPQTVNLAVPNPNRNLRGTTYGIYAQDQFRVSTRLTLNYGLRWELLEPYSDTHGALYTFDPATDGLVIPDNGASLINPLFPTNIPIVTASKAGYPANLVQMNHNNIEPRIGFAYKIRNNTVVRGGYGIYTNLIYASIARSQLSGGPFSGSVTYTNAFVGGAPLFSFPSPFLSTGTSGGSLQNVNGINPNLKTPYTQQWNMTVEHQIGNWGLRASYIGSRSDQLVYRRNLNQPPPSTTGFSQGARPYPAYFNNITYADSGGNQFYNALELAADKKYGQNLTVGSGFTWAKDLTDTQDSGSGGTTFGGQVIENQFDRAVEKANSAITVPHRFFAYALYDLPVGNGQRFFSGMHGVMQQVLGGWETTWVVISQSGQYFTPTFSGRDPSGTNTIGGVPDRIADGSIPNPTVEQWFDPSAFVAPSSNIGRFGNSGYNILAGPPTRDFDFGLLKNFNVWERVKLQFNMTMANALNHPNFRTPAANISSATTVGSISSQTNALVSNAVAREIDFGLRLEF